MGKIRLTESELIKLIKRIVEDTDIPMDDVEVSDDGIEDAPTEVESMVSKFSQNVDFCSPENAPETFVNNIRQKYPKLADKLGKVVDTFTSMSNPEQALGQLKTLVRDAKSKLKSRGTQNEQTGAGLASVLTIAGVTFTVGEVILVLGALYMLIYLFRCIKWRNRIKRRGTWPPLPFSGGLKNRKCDGSRGKWTPMGRM